MQTKRCTKCSEEKPHDQFSKAANKKDGLQTCCKVCHNAIKKLYRENNKQSIKQYADKYRENNKQNAAEYNKAYYQSTREIRLVRAKEYRQENPDKLLAAIAKRRAAKLQATPPWMTKKDFAEIQKFYTLSNELTELNGLIHHVDHIIPLNNPIVCGLHVPWNMQVLTGPENLAKSNKLILPVEMAWQ